MKRKLRECTHTEMYMWIFSAMQSNMNEREKMPTHNLTNSYPDFKWQALCSFEFI